MNNSEDGATTIKSFAFQPTKQHKGLQNNGENNCFLNVTIQALWHLSPFRIQLKQLIAFLDRPLVNKQQDHRLLVSLCNLFVQYEFTEEEVLPPQELRQSLSELSEKFRLGGIADANEALEMILQRIHSDFQSVCPHRGKCLSHSAFGGIILEQFVCPRCKCMTEPTIRSHFMMYFTAAEVLTLSAGVTTAAPSTTKNNQIIKENIIKRRSRSFFWTARRENKTEQRSSSPPDLPHSNFAHILHQCMVNVAPQSCINERVACKGKAMIQFYCLEPPLILALSFSWTSDREDPDTLSRFVSLIPLRIFLNDLFPRDDSPSNKGRCYAFHGMICYYGTHYISIFQGNSCSDDNEDECVYLLFDDHRVRPIGSWSDVIKLCRDAKYQPVLLLFELTAGSNGHPERGEIDCSLVGTTLNEQILHELFPEDEKGEAYKESESSSKETEYSEGKDSFHSQTSESKPRVLSSSSFASHNGLDISAIRDHLGLVGPLPVHCAPYKDVVKRVEPASPLVISNWVSRPLRYHLSFPLSRDRNGRAILGVDLSRDERGRSLVTGFVDHPETSRALAPRCSGLVSLMDELLRVNGEDVTKLTEAEVDARVQGLNKGPKESQEPFILLELESSCQRVLHYQCPRCLVMSALTPEEEEELLRKLSERVAGDAGSVVEMTCLYCKSSLLAVDCNPRKI